MVVNQNNNARVCVSKLGKKRKGTRGKKKKNRSTAETKRTVETKQREPSATAEQSATAEEMVSIQTSFGTIQLTRSMAEQLSSVLQRERRDVPHRLLDLRDLYSELDFVTPGGVRLAFVDAERMDPDTADELVEALPVLTPSLIIRGERGRLMTAAPILRRVCRVELFCGDTHGALMGWIYGLPRVVFSEYANGPEHNSAAEKLAELSETWDGRLLVLLISPTRADEESPHRPFSPGTLIAAHEVLLQRPILWHLGEQ